MFSRSLRVVRSAGGRNPALRDPFDQLPPSDSAQLRAEGGASQHAAAQHQRQVLRVHAEGGDQLPRDPQRRAERHAPQGEAGTEINTYCGFSCVCREWSEELRNKTSTSNERLFDSRL